MKLHMLGLTTPASIASQCVLAFDATFGPHGHFNGLQGASLDHFGFISPPDDYHQVRGAFAARLLGAREYYLPDGGLMTAGEQRPWTEGSAADSGAEEPVFWTWRTPFPALALVHAGGSQLRAGGGYLACRVDSLEDGAELLRSVDSPQFFPGMLAGQASLRVPLVTVPGGEGKGVYEFHLIASPLLEVVKNFDQTARTHGGA